MIASEWPAYFHRKRQSAEGLFAVSEIDPKLSVMAPVSRAQPSHSAIAGIKRGHKLRRVSVCVFLRFFARANESRCGEMADATDLKSVGL